VTPSITEKTVRQFIAEVSDQHHAMAGAVISASAAHAAALGEACMQISMDHQADKLDWQDVTRRIERIVHIKESLLDVCDQDATAIAEFVALREAGAELKGQQLLCQGPVQMGKLAIEAAVILQNFRPLVIEKVQDDLEMATSLLGGAAHAAMLLLDSNLRIWPEPELLEQFEPLRTQLETDIRNLTPAARIRE
jgi:formiminotetrahydrofolate cyclodeaminase